jgi:hypothetical protein
MAHDSSSSLLTAASRFTSAATHARHSSFSSVLNSPPRPKNCFTKRALKRPPIQVASAVGNDNTNTVAQNAPHFRLSSVAQNSWNLDLYGRLDIYLHSRVRHPSLPTALGHAPIPGYSDTCSSKISFPFKLKRQYWLMWNRYHIENARVSSVSLLSTSWCQYAGIHKQSPLPTLAMYRAELRNRAAEAGSAVSLANGDSKLILMYERPAAVILHAHDASERL